MLILVLGLAIFLGAHSVSIVSRPWRDAMVARLGAGGWRMAYTVVSLAGFALLVYGYGAAREAPVVLWSPPAWGRHVTFLLMVPVLILLVASNLRGHIRARLKHPLLVGTKLWALAHLLANGMLADLVLFGAFLAWAVLDRISFKRRGVGAPEGEPRVAHDAIAVVVGLGLYVAFVLWLHGWLIGVPLVPRVG
ncbi:MAG: NnrU family protein [Ectothiorhodospiraceae bacterium]|nr:NnrU family protein [Chromatiales bacterium]MCP5156547.1 NnrU family protein [Ectothiorhodospiraceae bacterium]